MDASVVAIVVLATWWAVVLLRHSKKPSGSPVSGPHGLVYWVKFEAFAFYNRRVAQIIIDARRWEHIDSFLESAGVQFDEPSSRDLAAELLFNGEGLSGVASSHQSIPLIDEILTQRLVRAYSAIEAQEFGLALTHVRSSGALDEADAPELANALFHFKPYLGIEHRYEIRYIIRWWRDVQAGRKLSWHERRDIKYVIRSFRPVGLYYSDQPLSDELEYAGGVRVEERGDPSVDLALEGDLLDVGADQGTPAAAADLVEGLDYLYHRLGPPPQSSALQPTGTSTGGGGYGGK
ncbi:hypothetical protein [Streptomyces lutosisoli]|uniref:Uncharacterized protein n=1 Tax=Streptomyces lutosisoli TaxID=2665721 RepID=A0ABW2VF77_9ACTN